MDPSSCNAEWDCPERSRLYKLGRRMLNPPPRFTVPPSQQQYYAPEIEVQTMRTDQHLGNTPALVHTLSPSNSVLSTSNYNSLAPFSMPEARHPHPGWTMGPSYLPTVRECASIAQNHVNWMSISQNHVFIPQALTHAHPSHPIQDPITQLHLYPRQPKPLPRNGSSFLSPMPRTSYKQVEAIEAATPYSATTKHIAAAYRWSSSSAHHPDNRLSTTSNNTPPQIIEVRTYITLMRKRFGCYITEALVTRLIDPEVLVKPLLSFDNKQLEVYKKHVRSWLAETTGTTIFERIRVALEPGTYVNGERYTVPYFWFVLLVRELLINNRYAMGSGTFIGLGACCMDPCNRSFQFFPLESAIRQLLRDIDLKPLFYKRNRALQKLVVGHCQSNHLCIATSDRPMFLPRPRFDKIDYQNELRAQFLGLVNRCDMISGFVAFVLMTFMGL